MRLVNKGLSEGERAFRIKARSILCCMRHMPSNELFMLLSAKQHCEIRFLHALFLSCVKDLPQMSMMVKKTALEVTGGAAARPTAL